MQQLNVVVRREHLMEDALNAFVRASATASATAPLPLFFGGGNAGANRLPKSRLKQPLVVRFHDEEGVDQGGLTKEFFQLLVIDIFNPNYSMFSFDEDAHTFWFSPNSFESLFQFELVGIIVGLALFNRVNLDLRFPPVLYKKLLSGKASAAARATAAKQGAERGQRGEGSIGTSEEERLLALGKSLATSQNLKEFDRYASMSDGDVIKAMQEILPAYLPSLDDLYHVHPFVAKGLAHLLSLETEQEVADLSLDFTVATEAFGESSAVPLPLTQKETTRLIEIEKNLTQSTPTDVRPNESSIKATNEPMEGKQAVADFDSSSGAIPGSWWETSVSLSNRELYAEGIMRYHLVSSIAPQFEAFQRGFFRCCGGAGLLRVAPAELSTIVCGVAGDVDVPSLQYSSEYADGYDASSPEIAWFWDIVTHYPESDRKKLLFFITGSDKIPLGGLKITISRAGGDVARIPTAHTCFNHLLLPPYPDRAMMKQFLDLALANRHGFGLK